MNPSAGHVTPFMVMPKKKIKNFIRAQHAGDAQSSQPSNAKKKKSLKSSAACGDGN